MTRPLHARRFSACGLTLLGFLWLLLHGGAEPKRSKTNFTPEERAMCIREGEPVASDSEEDNKNNEDNDSRVICDDNSAGPPRLPTAAEAQRQRRLEARTRARDARDATRQATLQECLRPPVADP